MPKNRCGRDILVYLLKWGLWHFQDWSRYDLFEENLKFKLYLRNIISFCLIFINNILFTFDQCNFFHCIFSRTFDCLGHSFRLRSNSNFFTVFFSRDAHKCFVLRNFADPFHFFFFRYLFLRFYFFIILLPTVFFINGALSPPM